MLYIRLVKDSLQQIAKDNGLRVAADTYVAFETVATGVLCRAMNRAKKNGRKTLQSCDL